MPKNEGETPDTGTVVPTDTEETVTGQPEETGVQKVMKELGLSGRYSTPEDALRAVAEKDRYIEEQRREHQRLTALNEQVAWALAERQRESEPSREELAEQLAQNPTETLGKLGYVKAEQMMPLIYQFEDVRKHLFFQEVAGAVASHSDLADVATYVAGGQEPPAGVNATWDKMRIWQMKTGISGRDPKVTIDILHRLATEGQAEILKPRIDARQKASASTSSPGRRVDAGEIPNFDGMTAQQQYEWYEKNGYVG